MSSTGFFPSNQGRDSLGNPMVSVIVPTYNRPDRLLHAIRSILCQSYQDFEIIVVNDAGVEAESVVLELADPRITYIRHPRNKGLAAARNTGIRAARGKYISYLDDDDHFYPLHLQTLVSFLENSSYQVAYTDAFRLHQEKVGDTYVDKGRDRPYSFDFDADRFLTGNYVPVLCFMHERACLDEVGVFDEQMTVLEDWDLWIRLSRKYAFAHIPQVTCEFTWRVDGSTMTSSKTLEFFTMEERIYQKYRAYSEHKPEVRAKQEAKLAWIQEQKRLNGLSGSDEANLGPTKSYLASIIIPVYNKVEYTQNCLEALIENTPAGSYEVILVDNASTDGTAEFFGQLEGDVTIIRNSTNLGFSKANNQGLNAARGEYVVFLNNDTEPQAGWLDALLEPLGNPAIGLVASKLLYPNGTIQHAGKAWSDTQSPEARPFHLYLGQPADFPPANKPREFQLVTGACVAMRRSDALELGGFDEGYLNGWEDDDLSMRVRHELGKKVWYNPRSVVIHHENATIKSVSHSNRANRERFMARWGERIIRDDITYYLEDGFVMRMGPDRQLVWGQAPVCQVEFPRILVGNLVRAGDVFLAEPIARKIKDRYPNATLTFVTAPAFAPLLEGNPAIDEVLPLGPNDYSEEAWDAVQDLAKTFDLAFLIQPLPDFEPHFFSTFRDGNWHIVDLYSAISGIDLRNERPQLYLTPEETASVEKVLEEAGGASSKPLIVFHTQSADWQKNWSLDKFALLATRLSENYPAYQIVVVGGSESVDVRLPGVVNLAGRLSLRESAALIAQAQLFVGIDSVCSHLTAQAQTPAVVLFGFTDPRYSRPINQNARCLKAPGHVTDELAFEPVWDAVQEALGSGADESAAAPSVSIVVLTWNQLDVTRLCVESLYRHTRDFELVLVDNASSDGTVDYLRALAAERGNVKLILNSSNRGFAGGCNQGMAAARGRDIVLLNNDTVVSEGWLEGLLEAANTTGAGLVGPRTNCITGPQQLESVPYDQQSLLGFEAFAQTWREQHRGEVVECPRIIGFCMLIRREVLDLIGGLDTGFGKGNFEDDDYCLRAGIAGFKVVVANEVFIHHFGSVTFKGQRIDYRELMAENWRRFKSKWRLPEDLPLEKGYRLADVLQLPFEEERHSEPLFAPGIAPLPLPEQGGFNIALIDSDIERIKSWVLAYLEAFEEADEVIMHLLAGPDVHEVSQVVEAAIMEAGRDPEHIPDISIVDAPGTPLELPRYLAAADLVIGDPKSVQGARDMGLPAFSEPGQASLRLAASHFPSVDWTLRPAPAPALSKERWLLDFESEWEVGLRYFLNSASSDADTTLIVRIPLGMADQVYESLSEWLTLEGYDPEQIPDVTITEWASDSILPLMHSSTAWVDLGDALKVAIAQALGLRVIRPSEHPLRAHAEVVEG